jgi:hypothetical protein
VGQEKKKRKKSTGDKETDKEGIKDKTCRKET